jgi:DNA ligase 1
MIKQTITLYTIDSKERTRVWVCSQIVKDGIHGISYSDGLLNGKLKDEIFKEAKIKNIGKSNETSSEEQAALMFEQEIGKKLRSNYFKSEEEAKNNKMFLPMLAHKYEDYQNKLVYPIYSQPKLDGSRCNIYYSKSEGRVVAMTRTGKEIVSVPHIIEILSPYLSKNQSLIFDGELYNHNLKNNFEKLMSIIRKTKLREDELKESKENIQYHIYDIYDSELPDLKYSERMQHLNKKLVSCLSEAVYTKKVNAQEDINNLLNPIKPVPNYLICDDKDLLSRLSFYLNAGFEGQMLRTLNGVYKIDSRSQDLLKHKIFHDEEFEIVDIEEGDGNWKGKAKKVVVKLNNGELCGCGIKGDFDKCAKILENKSNYIGKKATVTYFEKTTEGSLRFPVIKDIDRHD